MKIDNILLVCAGNIDYKLLEKYSQQSNLIIAIDGGYEYLNNINIVPNILIGDFDSNNIEISEDIKIIKFNPEKNESDTELALKYALDLMPNNIFILGATGNRLDHFLFNLNILHIALNKSKCYIIDSKNKIYMTNSYAEIDGKYKYFSIYPFSDHVEGLTITSAKYNVEDISITKYNSYTLSNEPINNAYVSIKRGLILIIESDDANVY